MLALSRMALSLSALLTFNAFAIDDFFDKIGPDSMNGFLVVTDKTYLRECGACHFAYSPGLLPAASWENLMSRPDKHFGDNIKLDPASSGAILRYLTENAADKSPYMGSKVIMERVKTPPARILSSPRLRDKHYVMREVIARNGNIKVKTFSNCDACHQAAAKGDFSLAELNVPGIHGIKKIKVDGYKAEKSLQ